MINAILSVLIICMAMAPAIWLMLRAATSAQRSTAVLLMIVSAVGILGIIETPAQSWNIQQAAKQFYEHEDYLVSE